MASHAVNLPQSVIKIEEIGGGYVSYLNKKKGNKSVQKPKQHVNENSYFDDLIIMSDIEKADNMHKHHAITK